MLKFNLKIFMVIFNILFLSAMIIPGIVLADESEDRKYSQSLEELEQELKATAVAPLPNDATRVYSFEVEKGQTVPLSVCANKTMEHPSKEDEYIDAHGMVPQRIMDNIRNVNEAVDHKVSRFLVIGRAVQCAAADFLGHEWSWWRITIKFPRVTLFIAGVIVWILGILLVMVVGYYLCDISFKLGFAILAMPIAIALWPFEKTKQYLGKIINLMLHCTGIFIFLCLGVTYACALFDAAALGEGGKDLLKEIVDHFDKSGGTLILEVFELASFNFLILLFASVVGFRLIGKCVSDYTKDFFPDSTGLGSQNPMHKGLTQATDFVKKQAGKVGGYAADVVKTQAGRVGAKAGGKISKVVGNIGKGMEKAADKMGAAGFLVKGVAKALQKGGKVGENMAANHEAKYQNQGKEGEVKNGRWQPKGEGGGGAAGGAANVNLGANGKDGKQDAGAANQTGGGGADPKAGGGATTPGGGK